MKSTRSEGEKRNVPCKQILSNHRFPVVQASSSLTLGSRSTFPTSEIGGRIRNSVDITSTDESNGQNTYTSLEFSTFEESERQYLTTYVFCLDNAFILSNARVVDYPIIFSNDGFTKISGYLRTDLMNKSSTCNFMYGELTSADTQVKIRDAFGNCHIEQVEVLLYKKNRTSPSLRR